MRGRGSEARGGLVGHPQSQELFSKAQNLIPGGVNSPVRSFRSVNGLPRFIARGKGSRMWDVDGYEYVDYLCSWGPLILGHAHPEVIAAVKAAAEGGTSFGAPVPQEIELAELVCRAFPSIDMVRMVSSGTEACMSAIRLARAFTGRSKIVKFSGCYHGHADGLLVKMGSGAMAQGVPTSAGVPESYAGETLVASYNDLESVERCFESHAGQVAGVIVEPVAGNMGVVPPGNGFLEGLRRITQDTGSLLIFDEVITGFRVSYGGAQALYGVGADITCLGKIIGGGLPVGAYGARREIMEMVSPLGPMYQAGTLSGNPLAVSAGIATLRALESPGVYEQLDSMASMLVQGLQRAARESQVPVCINRVGSMFTLFFNPGPVLSQAQVEECDSEMFSRFFHGMLERGVYLPPSQFEAGFVSLAHSEDDVEKTVATAAEVFRKLF